MSAWTRFWRWFKRNTDTISISGHDRETVISFEETAEFQAFNHTFKIIEREYQKNAEEVQL